MITLARLVAAIAAVAPLGGMAAGKASAEAARSEARQVSGVSLLFADGLSLVLKGWTVGLHLTSQTDAQVKAAMERAYGFTSAYQPLETIVVL